MAVPEPSNLDWNRQKHGTEQKFSGELTEPRQCAPLFPAVKAVACLGRMRLLVNLVALGLAIATRVK